MSAFRGPVLRLLDANANRAREALRVIEDCARFVLDDALLSKSLKAIRHDLTEILRPHLGEAILFRDTPGDVGTTNKTDAELSRVDVGDVVTAGGKRLGEALRSIEEYLKIIDPAGAARVEALRYRFYHLEQHLAYSLRPPTERAGEIELYVLITESICERPWLEAAEEAIVGGANALQLREKDIDSAELLDRAHRLVELCRRHDLPCIINDRPDIALLSNADGVHVGQTDLPVRAVRKLLGGDKIIGVSTHQIEQAKQAVQDGADYIGVGPFFKSTTKPRDFVAGPEYAREVAAKIPLHAVAIAGITAENVGDVLETGIRAVAVSSAVLSCQDVRAATAALKAKLHERAGAGGGGLFASPVSLSPVSLSPVSESSVSGGTDIPVCGLPVSGSPVSLSPVSESSVSQSPVSQSPVSGGTDIPVCGLPVSGSPVSQSPVSESSVSQSPVSQSPVSGGTDIPVCGLPVSGSPLSQSPVSKPVAQTFLSVSSPPSSVSSPGDLKITRRNLPHWEMDGATYFVTFRLRKGELNPDERALVLEHVKTGDNQWYDLIAAVIMPDHTHLLIRPNEGINLSRIMKGTKGVTARLINALRETNDYIWQDESWDRIMRDQQELDEKIGYMLNNPVKRGLVTDGWDYDGWFLNPKKR